MMLTLDKATEVCRAAENAKEGMTTLKNKENFLTEIDAIVVIINLSTAVEVQ